METTQAEPLAEVVRTVYLEHRTGIVQIDTSAGQENLYFREGALFVHPRHSAAKRLEAALERARKIARPAGLPEMQQAISALAHDLARNRRIEARFLQQTPPVQMIGPLPTVLLAMALATQGLNENDLIERLGGDHARYQTSNETPALQELAGLEPEMAQVLTRLEKPLLVSELVRGAGSHRLHLLRGLSKLRAVGLARRLDEKKLEEELLPPRLLDHFHKSIAQSLEAEPLELPANEHRARLGDLIAHLGERNHYELLGIGIRASADEVLRAYQQLARIVHPLHAQRLGFEGREDAIEVIFERATEAYLSLADPKRRASYNTLAGIQRLREIDPEKRQVEKRQMARENYVRATSLLAQMDYSQAVDLLKEAARLDPKADYFARLAQAQAKNPNWNKHAIESFRRAIELSPDDPGIRAGYGEVLEHMERFDEAKAQYKTALELMPDNIMAQSGLDRIKQYV